MAIAIAGVALWYFWGLFTPPPAPGASISREPFVQLVTAGSATNDQVLRERADLLDPTPLFFPTARNFEQRSLNGERLRQPGQVFGSFPPKFTVPDQSLVLRAEPGALPQKLAEWLGAGSEADFAGMGEQRHPASTLPVRSAHVEVTNLATGAVIVNQSLSGFDLASADSSPAEFLVLVGAAGIIGEPFMVLGSESDEVDTFYRDYLVRSYRLGQRLAPGRYRVRLGS